MRCFSVASWTADTVISGRSLFYQLGNRSPQRASLQRFYGARDCFLQFDKHIVRIRVIVRVHVRRAKLHYGALLEPRSVCELCAGEEHSLAKLIPSVRFWELVTWQDNWCAVTPVISNNHLGKNVQGLVGTWGQLRRADTQ